MKKLGEIAAFKHASRGIIDAYRRERHMRFHFFAAILVVLAAIVLNINAMEWIAILIVIGCMLALEMMNSAIEAVVDKVSPEIHPIAKYVKDVAAGAVLIMAIIAAVVGIIIFLPKIMALF